MVKAETALMGKIPRAVQALEVKLPMLVLEGIIEFQLPLLSINAMHLGQTIMVPFVTIWKRNRC